MTSEGSIVILQYYDKANLNNDFQILNNPNYKSRQMSLSHQTTLLSESSFTASDVFVCISIIDCVFLYL